MREKWRKEKREGEEVKMQDTKRGKVDRRRRESDNREEERRSE